MSISTLLIVASLVSSISAANGPLRSSDPPKQLDLWDLRYYYNWIRILHAFAATPEGLTKIQRNGIGPYTEKCNDCGSLGGTLSDEGYSRLAEDCTDPEERKHIVKMWFSKTGHTYQHIFEDSKLPKDVYVGYVSTKAGACGSKWPVKKWGCQVSQDIMYHGDMSSNAWYKGREKDGGVVHFWLWEMTDAQREKLKISPNKEKPTNAVPLSSTSATKGVLRCTPSQKDLWDIRHYYNSGQILHAFAATPEGLNKIQSNGIGYSTPETGCGGGCGSLGGALSDEGYARLAEVCTDPEERKHIVKMWFTKVGQAYQHIFEDSRLQKDVYVGYVSRKANACGSKFPMKRWGSQLSKDMMYAGDLSRNVWYKGREQDGGVVHFWTWDMDETEREKQREC